MNVYGFPEPVKLDKGSAIISKEYKNLGNEHKVILNYDTPSLNTGTRLAFLDVKGMRGQHVFILEMRLSLR